MPQPLVKKFVPKSASDHEFKAFNNYANKLGAEVSPDDPPKSLDYRKNNLRNLPDLATVHIWVLWLGDGIIADSNILIFNTEENKHLAQVGLGVLAPWRRKGYTKMLLPPLIKIAKLNDRRLLIGDTSSTIPAGEGFAQHLGAKAGLIGHTNQLDLKDLNLDLMQQWQARAKERASEFDLIAWVNETPEDIIEDFIRLMEVMNSQPLDDLDVEDSHFSIEELRQMEAYKKAKGTHTWVLVARHKSSGKLAGYTDISWQAENPELLSQGDTGVLSAYRGKGLGRWLKAAMLEQVLKEKTEAKRVRTSNADSNAAMLSINTEMGFKPHKAMTMWQLDVAEVATYLEG